MKIMHTSDLHLGKVLNGYSLIDDQKDILEGYLGTAKEKDGCHYDLGIFTINLYQVRKRLLMISYIKPAIPGHQELLQSVATMILWKG